MSGKEQVSAPPRLHKTCTLLSLPLLIGAVVGLNYCVTRYILWERLVLPWCAYDPMGWRTMVVVVVSIVSGRPQWLHEYLWYGSRPSIALTCVLYPIVVPHVLWTAVQHWLQDGRARGLASGDLSRGIHPLPPVLRKSASELGAMVRSQEITSSELTRMCIDHLVRCNADLNAVVGTRFAEAMEEAERADRIIQKRSRTPRKANSNMPGPFFGVPIISKECYETVGQPYTGGIVGRKGRVGMHNSPVVQQCMDAGMIVLGVTNTSEGCMFHESNNQVHGQTNNPYDLSRSPGGSSGGCAAICATGACPMAIASDVGGSIRIPSLFCGLFGHKPTGGAVSNDRTYPRTGSRGVDRFCQLGPITRHACDLMPFLNVMKKIPPPDDVTPELADPRAVRVGDPGFTVYVIDQPIGGWLLRSSFDEEMRAAQSRCAQALRESGANVVPLTLGSLGEGNNAFSFWGAKMDTEKLEPFLDTIGEGVTSCSYFPVVEFFKSCLGVVPGTRHTIPAIGLAVLEMLVALFPAERKRLVDQFDNEKARLEALLAADENAVLLLPTLPSTAFRHHEGLLRFFDVASTCLFNVLEFPATNIPLGLSARNGMPMGVQCVAGPWQDHKSIAVALHLEALGIARWDPPSGTH